MDASGNGNYANGLNRSEEKKQNSINKPQQDGENNELIISYYCLLVIIFLQILRFAGCACWIKHALLDPNAKVLQVSSS